MFVNQKEQGTAMLNKYPLWKYLLIVFVIVVGGIYALPNLYPADPAIQIRSNSRSITVDDQLVERTKQILETAKIPVKAIELENESLLVRLTEMDNQALAKSYLHDQLGTDYIVALNLAPTTPEWLASIGAEPMKLGLDLSGGVHFLLEVDMNKAVDARLKVLDSEIRTMLRKEGIRYRNAPVLEDKSHQLSFRSAADRDKAERMVKAEHNQLTTRAFDNGDKYLLAYNFAESRLIEIEDYAIKQNLTSLRNRVNELGVSEPLVQRQGRNRIVVELPGVQDTAQAKGIIGKTANLEFRLEAKADSTATEQYRFRDDKNPPANLERDVILTGDLVSDASASFDENGRPQVNITLNGNGGDLMNRATRYNVGRRMAVVFIEQKPLPPKEITKVVNGKEVTEIKQSFREEKHIISLATIQSALNTQFRITGLDSVAESSELALLLRAGALAAPMYFVEERTIGPSLGKANIEMGFKSVAVGFALVLAFMLVYYKVFGVFANIALTFNLVLLIAVLSMFSATLTLPGIAGIVLTVGMAVDANVLIFSRIKEELAQGLSPQQAIHEGYNRAFVAILDANITTFIVAIILLSFGTGPVQGFAVTLAIGIVTSLFTAILFTRAMVNMVLGGKQLQKLWI